MSFEQPPVNQWPEESEEKSDMEKRLDEYMAQGMTREVAGKKVMEETFPHTLEVDKKMTELHGDAYVNAPEHAHTEVGDYEGDEGNDE